MSRHTLWRGGSRAFVGPRADLQYRHAVLALVALSFCLPAHGDEPVNLEYADPLQLEYLPPSFYDFPPEELALEPRDGVWLDSTNWIMRQRDIQSDRIENFGDWMDQVLSGEAIRTPTNESYLRIGFATRWEKDSWVDFEPEARFRLDLPTVKEKFRLIVESTPDEFIPLREQERDRRLTDSERSDRSPTGALRYLTRLTERWSVSNDLGIRFRWPLNPFWRTELSASWNENGPWRVDVEQRFFYFHVDGWGERTQLTFSRLYSASHALAFQTEMQWVDRDSRFEWSNVAYLDHVIDNRSRITYRTGVVGESKPNWRPTAYFLDATWRYRLHDDWLFGEIIPSLEFPREDDFRENPAITFRIEMYFAGDDNTDYYQY